MDETDNENELDFGILRINTTFYGVSESSQCSTANLGISPTIESMGCRANVITPNRGEITRVNSDGSYDIKFEDGERKRGVREEQIEGGDDDDRDRGRDSRSSSTKKRREGDRVKAKCSGTIRW